LNRALDALVLRMHLQSSSSIDRGNAELILHDLVKKELEIRLTPEKIIASSAAHFGLRPDAILGKAQTQECVWPRQIAMYLCRKELRHSYGALGRLFLRDHSTVMASVKQVEQKVNDHDSETL